MARIKGGMNAKKKHNRISATFVEDRRNKGKNGKRCGENTALSSFQMECSFL